MRNRKEERWINGVMGVLMDWRECGEERKCKLIALSLFQGQLCSQSEVSSVWKMATDWLMTSKSLCFF